MKKLTDKKAQESNKGKRNRQKLNKKTNRRKDELPGKEIKVSANCAGELVTGNICDACGLRGTPQCRLNLSGTILPKPLVDLKEQCDGCDGSFCVAEGIGPCMRDEQLVVSVVSGMIN